MKRLFCLAVSLALICWLPGCSPTPSRASPAPGSVVRGVTDYDLQKTVLSGNLPVHLVARHTSAAKYRLAADYICDGGGDDDVEIQAACTRAGIDGGGVVQLAVGDYSIGTLILVPSNVTIRGSGHGTVLTVVDNADVGVFRNFDAVGGNTNIVIENMRLEGNKANQGAAACRGVWFSNVVRGRVSGVWANDFQGAGTSTTRGIGIFIDDSDYIVVENCYAKDNNYDNIGVRNGSTNCVVTGCVCVDAAGRAGIQVVEATNIILSDNVCVGNAQDGISIHEGVGISVIGNSCDTNTGAGITVLSITGGHSTDVTVSNNVCNENTAQGILVYNIDSGVTERVVISGNTVFGNGASGIQTNAGVEYTTIDANVVYNNTSRGIYVLSNHHVVSNNIVIDNADRNIMVNGGDFVVVEGNYCEGSTTYGIYAYQADSIIIANNFTGGHSTAGIRTNETTNAKVFGNFSTDTTPIMHYEAAITLGAGVTTFVVGNNVMTITGDGGANTIATITGGMASELLTLIFVDALVTITDTDAHTANTVDLSAALAPAADDLVLQLVFDGISWYEVSRSAN